MRRYRCTKCGRRIKYPHFIDRLPYGITCASKVQSHIQKQIDENKQSIRNINQYLEEGIWQELPKHNPVKPETYVSYANRKELIEELITVLAERNLITT